MLAPMVSTMIAEKITENKMSQVLDRLNIKRFGHGDIEFESSVVG